MIDIKKDPKADAFIITQTDSEGFHKQMTMTWEELTKIATYIYIYIENILHNNL